MWRFICIAIILLCVLLGGCADDILDENEFPDKIAPEVVSSSIEQGSTVSIDTITVVFSEEMKSAIIVVSDILGTTSLDSSGKLATWESSIDPTEGMHKLTVSGEDLYGNALKTYEVDFKIKTRITDDMALIESGEFLMGSDDAYNEEKPVHTVYLDAFYIDEYEVTNAKYKKFMDATGHNAPTYWYNSSYNSPNQPVVGVIWEDANAYAKWAGKRLPTEAEWEKAARGGLAGKKHVWGDEWPPPDGAGNFADELAKKVFASWIVIEGYNDGYLYPAPVGSFSSNGYGLYDMEGNVHEWCSDWYDVGYYANSPKSNPTGPSSGSFRIVRGGSFYSGDQGDLRIALRHTGNPAHAFETVGFRCAVSPSE